MRLGFTGTQGGMTDAQLEGVYQLVPMVLGIDNIDEVHLGDCIGSDATMWTVANDFCLRTIAHPPSDMKKRAMLIYDEYREPLPYLDRNHVMVDESDVLIATPVQGYEILRSGTWATIRYARKAQSVRPLTIYIIWPDGTTTTETT